jgi:hypothetical protein
LTASSALLDKTEWDLTQFFVRPVALVLAVLTLLTWFSPLLLGLLQRAGRAPSAA